MTYFNTNKLTNPELKDAAETTLYHSDIIRNIFLFVPRVGYTPYQVLDMWPEGLKKPLITSVRRSMNTLTDKDFLIKLDETVMEREGSPNHLWKLSPTVKIATTPQGQLELNV